ncbi:BMP family ABC transporter substrate-binding protein [Anaerobacillus alkalidiazotrophicus]|uniref:BMP family ABC transporter substrate-binding protein n=1 Tax=Anaerobacillus alkalidiazotrophicus TaxID=472963 RepID=A0A1S2M9Z1_9BACI|nr:BMP family protein [Anaerobacillus alkalidiazotrophicus]OIJ21426.1 BMP family ABC transporter substrate-binding protein [Anaerobacillus alkalidiazotrophicus]
MKKRKFSIIMSLTLAVGTLLTACGQGAEPADFSVKMVTDVGGVDDKSFNESAWEGLQKFESEFGVEVGYLQSGDAADYQPNLNRLVREGNDLVFAIGFLMGDDVKAVAEQQQDARLAIVDMVVEGDDGNLMENVANITFKEHEGSFLVGVIAGLQTKTNKVGFLGGVDGFLIKKFESGFKAGVKAVNPDAEIIVQYAESFNDASRGQAIADTIYAQGADIIYHAAGGTGNGLFTEAKERKRAGEDVWAIGVDKDQHDEGLPENVTLTSMVKRVDQAVYFVSERTMNGEYPGGQIVEFGLEEEGVGIAPTTENVDEESLQAVEEWKQKILDGEVDVPMNTEEYEDFIENL